MSSPIAIIGVGAQLPGGDRDLTELEEIEAFFAHRGDAVSDVPQSRWNAEAFYSPSPNAAGAMFVRRGAFLHWDHTAFDYALFGISPKEAGLMDPQQRLVIETALRCLDHARADFDGLWGSRAGVFIGGFMLDHYGSTMHPSNRDHIAAHTATSSTMTMLSNRLSFLLGLRGPSMTVDTACSSSLVAIHLACRALQAKDADYCVAGGVNFMTRPETMMMLCKGRFLAADGRSKSFDSSADGYGRGEGSVLFALKRLEDATHDGDDVLGVVRATGVNQDGATPGITVPSRESQTQLINEVYASADVTAKDIDLVEAHGTGTPVGDPIEVGALSDVLGSRDRATIPLGSAKAALGHQEANAGALGVLKALCSVRNRVAYPQGWFNELNPDLELDRTPFTILDRATQALGGSGSAAASVNSFGYGGTNAHAVVTSA